MARKPLKVSFNDYTPTPKQMEFHKACDEKRFVLLATGVRFGKTLAGAYQLRRNIYLKKMEPPLHWIVAPIYDQAAQACTYFERAVESCIIRTTGRPGRPMTFWLRPPVGYKYPVIIVDVKSGENPSHLRGRQLASVWEDEARDIPEESHNVIMQRVLDSSGQVFMTTTTRGRSHWLFERVWQKWKSGDKDYGVVTASTYDNPHLRSEDIAQLERDFPAEYGRQELYGDFINLSGLVYHQFDRGRHVVQQSFALPSEFQCQVIGEPAPRVFVGVDFGYSDPCVVHWVADWKNQYWVLGEHCVQGQVTAYHAKAILDNPLTRLAEAIYCDPNDLKSRMELVAAFKKVGRDDVAGKLMPAPRDGSGRDPNFMVGIRLIARLLLEDKIQIFPECANLIREFGLYHFSESGQHNIDDRPVDKWNHGLDALRYALRGWTSYQHGPRVTKPDMDSAAGWSPDVVRKVSSGVLAETGAKPDFPNWYTED